MYILDTDTLSYLHAGHTRVAQRLRQLDDPEVGTTIITKIEMLRGRFDYALKAETSAELLKAHRMLARTEELLAQLFIIPFDEAAARRFDELRAQRSLRKIGRADLLIASIALSRRATLVTRNLKHFRGVPGLRLENWVD
jgi:tRNA(fMet)-specific endonuclease VapC